MLIGIIGFESCLHHHCTPANKNIIDKNYYFLMEEKTAFENFLFGDGNEIVINDIEFFVDRIVMLPKIRPHQLEKAVRLSVEYCQIADCHRKLLEKTNHCPVLIYQLHKRGAIVFEEVEPYIRNEDSFLTCYYFRKAIQNFACFIQEKEKPYNFDETLYENQDFLDQVIEYGFPPSSIEYCLKYDDIDCLMNIGILNRKINWSPFEWAKYPTILGFLSFSGLFGSIKCFKFLLLNGFQITENVASMVICNGYLDLYHLCKGQQLYTPEHLYRASEFFHILLIGFMIENNTEIDTIKFPSRIALNCAAENGHLSVVQYLINQKADINEKDKDDWTPLHLAARNGHLSVVEYLINQKADINAQSNGYPSGTPLHYAAENGHLSVVQYLINQKADINANKVNDCTPLHLAAENGHLSVVEYLVNQKADINAKDKNNQTPLHYAAQNDHPSIVDYLVNQKDDQNE